MIRLGKCGGIALYNTSMMITAKTATEVYVGERLLMDRYGVRFVSHGKSTVGTYRNSKGQFVTGKAAPRSEAVVIAADKLLVSWSYVKSEAEQMEREMDWYNQASHGSWS